MSIGATYCVYEDSGFLKESVLRLYPAMDLILILIDKVPWNGDLDNSILQETYLRARSIPDPDNKIEIITKYWKTEADERNFALNYLYQRNISWCFVCDEDELYNTSDIQRYLPNINEENFSVYLFKHQLYWKNRDTVLINPDCFFPTIIYTKPGRVVFTEARMVTVFEGKKWETIPPELVVCHHMSYVRTDDQMFRKIMNFSHVDMLIKGWYEAKWLNWKLGDTDMHPVNPSSFKGTQPSSEALYKLETL